MTNIVHLLFILSLLLLFLDVESVRNAPKGVSKSPTRSLIRKHRQAKTKRLVVLPAKKEKLATKLMRGLTHVSERLRQTVKVTAESVNRLSRDATAYFSSDFEVLLLEMTAPTNSMTSPADIDKFITTTQSFIYNDDLVSQSNTYRVTLRKIWAKIAERHPLTVLKALHVLHSLLRATRPKDGKLYQRLILKMCREHSKKTRSKYFSKARPSAGALSTLLTVEDGPVQQFTDRYYSYVIARGKQFTSSFAELEGVSFKTSGPDALKTVLKRSSWWVSLPLDSYFPTFVPGTNGGQSGGSGTALLRERRAGGRGGRALPGAGRR
jgi:hypothetical protein